MLKYMEILRFDYHDPHRHEEQTDAARGGLPGVLRAKALVFCASEDGGAWCKAASEAVDLGAGLQFARFPRSRRGGQDANRR